MSIEKERELLKRVISGDDDGDFFVSYDLYKEIYELLAQPEQDQAGAVMLNGVCVSNVYDAYEEGRKSVMSEQEPVAWMNDSGGCFLSDGKKKCLGFFKTTEEAYDAYKNESI